MVDRVNKYCAAKYAFSSAIYIKYSTTKVNSECFFRNYMKAHEVFGMNYNGRLKGISLFISY